jgi:fatty acid synthase subunit beta
VIVLGERGRGGTALYDFVFLNFSTTFPVYSNGKVYIEVAFSRPLGKPSAVASGITPSSVKAGFVNTFLGAGYHIELAGGGHCDPAAVGA